MEPEFICTLHSVAGNECANRDYKRICEMKTGGSFWTTTCPYRLKAVELPVKPDTEKYEAHFAKVATDEPAVEKASVDEEPL